MGALPGPLEFACPYCQSAAGRECLTSGVKRRGPHRARFTRRMVWIRTGGEFVVRLLKTDARLGLTAGEEYVAISCWLDPEKVTLVRRVSDGHDPECNEYARSVEFVRIVAQENTAARRKWATERLADTFTPHISTGEGRTDRPASPRENP